MPEQDDLSIETVNIEDELAKSYVNYAMSVIISRALPDVRDGLKPVQRRILFAMRDLNLSPDRPFQKCAKVTGQTAGDYHPHGDVVIYPTLVRMGQNFSMRYPLITPQGNYGSIDGDPPAAQRYTECRLAPLAMELMEDIDKDTVEWMRNYSDSKDEPMYFPGKFPNLLCNGTQGIAVGMATSMPPHNLVEVCNVLLLRLEKPDCTLAEMMEVLPGPDFPTYGLIMGKKGITDAYETGRGSVIMQAKTMIEPAEMGKSKIVITELPYQVNKNNLVMAMAQLGKLKKFDGITDVQDFSDKRGMRIEVELRRDVNPNKALNYLLKHTQLRQTFGCIMLSLVNGSPRVSPLSVLLDEYLKHRQQIITARTRYELFRALEQLHHLEGFQIVRRNLDAVIKAIRESADAAAALARLVREFALSPAQGMAILAMPLRRLTQLEQDKLEADYKDALRKVAELMNILTNPARLKEIMVEEITYLRDKYGDERRTKIIAREAGEFSEADLIPEEEAIISISRDGYIKRISIDAYRQQKRGGKGLKSVMKQDDEPAHLFQINTHHYVLFFTDRGRVFKLRAYDIPESSRYSRGMPVINYIAIESDEKVTATVSVKDISGEGFLTMITKYGEIKRTSMDKFANIRSNGIRAFDIEEGDELGWVLASGGSNHIIIVTHNGMSIRFDERKVTDRSRAAGGVRAIKLREGDFIVGADIADDERWLLVVGENGYGKRTPISEYREQNRGGIGILTMNCTEKTGRIVSAEVVEAEDRLIVLTTMGQGIRIKVSPIREVKRVAQGVKLINLKEGDQVASIARLVHSPDDGENPQSDDEDSASEE